MNWRKKNKKALMFLFSSCIIDSCVFFWQRQNVYCKNIPDCIYVSQVNLHGFPIRAHIYIHITHFGIRCENSICLVENPRIYVCICLWQSRSWLLEPWRKFIRSKGQTLFFIFFFIFSFSLHSHFQIHKILFILFFSPSLYRFLILDSLLETLKRRKGYEKKTLMGIWDLYIYTKNSIDFTLPLIEELANGEW